MAVVFPVVWRLLDICGVAKIDLAFDDIVRNKVVTVTVPFRFCSVCVKVERKEVFCAHCCHMGTAIKHSVQAGLV